MRASVVAAEIAWLNGKADEPGWPEFPALRRIFRRGIRLGGSRGRVREDDMIDTVEEGWRTDYQAAALWLEAITTRMGAAVCSR